MTDSKAVRLRYEYTALPHGVIARFIVRTHRFGKGRQRWRYGVELAWEGATALIRAHVARNLVEVTLRGPTDDLQRLAAVVREHFGNIHESLKGPKPVEWIEVKSGSGVYERVSHLAEMEKKPAPIFVPSLQGPVEVDQTVVLNRMEPEEIRKNPPSIRVKVFVSYAHADIGLKEKLDVNLTILSHQKLIEPWTDNRIRGGEDWNEVIERNERAADLILFLVSRNFLASGYIRNHEIPVALEQKEKKGARIVPVILHQYDGWQVEDKWGKLHPLPAWGKSVEDYLSPEKGFDVVDSELRKIIREVAEQIKETDPDGRRIMREIKAGRYPDSDAVGTE